MDQNHKKYKLFIICLLPVVLTLVFYLRVANYEFVNYDDLAYVGENKNILPGLTFDGIKYAFTTNWTANWHPLTWLSLMLDCQVSENTARMCHLTNLFFHLANTLLMFIVFYSMTSCPWRSAMVAALFALHPLHVDSVAWVSARKDVLSTFFWLLTMGAYVHYTHQRSVSRYILIVLPFVLGLMAKPMLVTLPCVLLLMDYWPLKNKNVSVKFLILEKLPLFTLTALSSVVTFFVQRSVGVVKSLESLDIHSRFANATVSYMLYIYKMIWPVKLAVFYPHPINIPVIQEIIAFALLLIITILVIWLGRKYRYLLVGWLWFLGTMIPVIGLIQVGIQQLADRYTYVPLTGLFIMITWTMWDLLAKKYFGKVLLAIASSSILVILSVFTWFQVSVWQNNETLYRHALKVTQKNYLAHNNLAVYLNQLERKDEAIYHWQKAVKIRPAYKEAVSGLGPKLIERGKLDQAVSMYQCYLQSVKSDPGAYKNLADAYFKKNNFDLALKYYQKALDLNLATPGLFNNYASTLYKKQKVEPALQYYNKALNLDPDYKAAHNSIAVVYYYQGNYKQAAKHYKRATELEPTKPLTWNNYGAVLLKLNQLDSALPCFEQALKLNPDYIDGRINLAATLLALKKNDAAVKQYKAILKIDPNNKLAKLGLTQAQKNN